MFLYVHKGKVKGYFYMPLNMLIIQDLSVRKDSVVNNHIYLVCIFNLGNRAYFCVVGHTLMHGSRV